LDAIGWVRLVSRHKSAAGSRLVRRNPPQTRAAPGWVTPINSSDACVVSPRVITNDQA
jgi:hypothetical protein